MIELSAVYLPEKVFRVPMSLLPFQAAINPSSRAFGSWEDVNPYGMMCSRVWMLDALADGQEKDLVDASTITLSEGN